MILCVGLTPTVQRTLVFERFVVGEVNRAQRVVTTASGKASNVARMAATLGAEVRLVHSLGGDPGRYVERTLHAEGVAQEVVWDSADAPTRTCTTLLTQGGPTTELVEEAPPLSESDRAALRDRVVAQLPAAAVLCLSGSLAPGTPPEFYADLIRAAQGCGVPTVVDAQKEPLRLALAEKPFLAKPNRAEALAALALPATTTAADAARALRAAGAQNALVSEGKSGAVLATAAGEIQLTPPEVEALNPIGSGDALTAGLLVAHFCDGRPLTEAVAFGMAVAAANCLTLTSGVIEPETVARIAKSMGISR